MADEIPTHDTTPYRSAAYLLYAFFQDFALVYPVYVIMFQQSGLDFSRIGYLLAIWAATVLLLEVPLGVVADLWSRRGMIVIGLTMKAAGFLVWMVRPDFTGFTVGFVLWGVQEACTTGTIDALVYDGLRERRREDLFVKITGRGALAARSGILLSVLLGGWVFTRSVSVVMTVSALSMIIAAVCASFIPGTARSKLPELPERAKTPVAGIRDTFRAVWSVPGIVPLVLFGSVAFVTYGVLDEYDFLLGVEYGVPVAAIGLWGSVRFLLEGAAGTLAHRLERWLRLDRPARLAGWVALGGVLLILGVATGLAGLLPFYFLFYLVMASGEVIYRARLQERIESAGRATVSSFFSFLETGSGIAMILAAGWIAQLLDLRAIFVAGGATVIVSALLFILLLFQDASSRG